MFQWFSSFICFLSSVGLGEGEKKSRTVLSEMPQGFVFLTKHLHETIVRCHPVVVILVILHVSNTRLDKFAYLVSGAYLDYKCLDEEGPAAI